MRSRSSTKPPPPPAEVPTSLSNGTPVSEQTASYYAAMVSSANSGASAVSLTSRVAAYLGSLGGLKGGPARARALSPERRSEIAKQAATARWNLGKPAPEDTP